MKLFGYLNVDENKGSIDSSKSPTGDARPTSDAESIEPTFPDFGDSAKYEYETSQSDEPSNARHDEQSNAEEPDDEQEPRPERPSLSLGDMLVHPLIAWLIQTMIVGLLFVTIGVLVIIWNPEQGYLKFGRMIPAAEGIILWIVAKRRLLLFRHLTAHASENPGCFLPAIFGPPLFVFVVMYEFGSVNMAATTTVIAIVGAVMSIVTLRETVRRMNILSSGVPTKGIVIAEENPASMTDHPGTLTKLQWAFDAGGVTYSASCRVSGSQELASRVAFDTAIVMYLPTNPKKSVAYVDIASAGKRRWIRDSLLVHPLVIISVLAIAGIVIREAVPWAMDKRRAGRLQEVSALLAIEDDCEFDQRWPADYSFVEKDEYTLQFADIARARRKNCKRRWEVNAVLALTDDCTFEQRWKLLDTDDETMKHQAIAESRIQACETATREREEASKANPPGDKPSLSSAEVSDIVRQIQPSNAQIQELMDRRFPPDGKTLCKRQCQTAGVGNDSQQLQACLVTCDAVYRTR